MSKIFIFHGSFGHPQENWFPWLKSELEKMGHQVIIPQFPTPEGQTLNKWMEVFDKYISQVDTDTIFVGHSTGVPFILSVLEQLKVNIKRVYLVSGFVNLINHETFDPLIETFVEKEFDWAKINKNCAKFVIYHSDNDPYVPINSAHEFADKLGVNVNIVSNAGHINEESGYIKFDLLLENIKSVL